MSTEKFGHTDRAMLEGLVKATKEFLAADSRARHPLCLNKYRGAVRTKMTEKLRREAGQARESLNAVLAEIEGEMKS